MHSDTALYNMLTTTLNELDAAIDRAKAEAARREINWLSLRGADGSNPAAQMLVAKAHVLQALAALKISAKK